MRRKIEKYLAKKQGVDQANIRYTEDGRFDFMGDLEGVLAAVRGKDGAGRGRGKERLSKKKKKKDEMMRPNHPGALIPMPYGPYAMAHGFPRGPPMHMAMMCPKDKKPGNPYGFSPWQPAGLPMPPPEPATSSGMSPYDVNGVDVTPANKVDGSLRNIDFTANCFSSARKSVFDSPKSLGGNLGLNIMSPTEMNVQGMTPMSSLHDTFTTPFQKDMPDDLSPGDDTNLNKMLFADDNDFRHDSFLKTPNFRATREKIHFRIGNDSAIVNVSMADMRINRVSISPISQSAACSSFFSDVDSEISSCFKSVGEASINTATDATTDSKRKEEQTDKRNKTSDAEMMPPPSTHASKSKTPAPTTTTCGFVSGSSIPTTASKADTPQNVMQGMGAPTPFETSCKIMGSIMTPSTAASSEPSFWSQHLGFTPGENAFTPFRSPAAPFIKHDTQLAKRPGMHPFVRWQVPFFFVRNCFLHKLTSIYFS